MYVLVVIFTGFRACPERLSLTVSDFTSRGIIPPLRCAAVVSVQFSRCLVTDGGWKWSRRGRGAAGGSRDVWRLFFNIKLFI